MRNEILSEILAEYENQRLLNHQEELHRQALALEKCPELANLLEDRRSIIAGGIMGILQGASSPEDLPRRMEVLNLRITDVLKSGGFPADWLEPVYRCSLCRDTGYVGEPIREQCQCLRRRVCQRLYRQVGINSAEDQSFEHYNDALIPEEACAENGLSQRLWTAGIRKGCEHYADRWPQTEPKDLLLMGKSGLGKTFLMNAIARRLLERDINVLVISAFRYFELARKAYFSGDDTALSSLREADVLLIDDLGSEPLMDNITIPQWLALIDERRAAGKGTVFSTNLSEADLRNRYTERLSSRLLDRHFCTAFTFFGKDLRQA